MSILRTECQRQRPRDSFRRRDLEDGSRDVVEKAMEEIRRSGALVWGRWMDGDRYVEIQTVIWCLHSTSMLLLSYLCRDYLIDWWRPLSSSSSSSLLLSPAFTLQHMHITDFIFSLDFPYHSLSHTQVLFVLYEFTFSFVFFIYFVSVSRLLTTL